MSVDTAIGSIPPSQLIGGSQQGFTENKITTVYLHEPLHFKAIPFKDGYRIEFSIKMHWDQVDSMNDPDMPIMKGVANMINIIENQLHSRVLDVKRKDDANV